MFRPNTTCTLSRAGGFTLHGEPQVGEPERGTPCAVVRLNETLERTTVRADASATRGAAEEDTTTSRMMFPTSVHISQHDKVEIAGLALRVISVEPRFAVGGRHDHDEVKLGIWSE